MFFFLNAFQMLQNVTDFQMLLALYYVTRENTAWLIVAVCKRRIYSTIRILATLKPRCCTLSSFLWI